MEDLPSHLHVSKGTWRHVQQRDFMSPFAMLHVCKCFSYRLILGMMMTSSFLSMWLSNTATTAMMLPIANAILESLFGDLQTLKEKCKSPSDPELDLINGTEQNQLSTQSAFLFMWI